MNDPSRFWTPSNILSLTRGALIIPFALVALSSIPGARLWGCLIMAAAALTDKLDGQLARKTGTVTEWGKILDPLADKLGVAAAALVLLILGAIPIWFLIALVARDLLILSGGAFLRWKKGVLLPSNQTGKWAVGVISLTLFLALADIVPVVVTFLTWLSAAMLAASFVLYIRRFLLALFPEAEAVS